ncbi:DUF4333 domain-containing protein [Nocardioides sp. Leaf307]|uniref:DUF4333 domain-containing protein n=1 Tax=Nocardioides sp. Leaf307 TaxID=1736331 RepID=UPI000703AA0A|nr:DUF4333 domain-containing protein [Nocardioides sp. Leaf307]KQQ42606.1 hypothetical protein ASF50_00640 [Nocardioides sp. Leaf307]
MPRPTRQPSTSSPARRAGLALAAAVALLAAGCSGSVSAGTDTASDTASDTDSDTATDPGTVAQEELETQVAGFITGADADTIDVTCEGDLDAEEGASQECVATAEGDPQQTNIRATVETVNEDDVDFSIDLYVTAAALADFVADYVEGQGITVDSVECSDDLSATAGDTSRCEIASPDGEGAVEATSTGNDGLQVIFDIVDAG